MTYQELYSLLSSIVVIESPQKLMNVAYDHFDSKVEPPFILFRCEDTTTFKADDMVYAQDNNYIVDLIYEVKSSGILLEQKLETKLNQNHIPYDKEEAYLSDERIYQIRYFI